MSRQVSIAHLHLMVSLIFCDLTFAQQMTIQQPVVSQFRVDTVVSVPDGGRVLLGAVGGARDARSQFGFTPLGSSLGIERFHQSSDVSVFIHDFDAMDRAILSSGTEMENPWTGEITQGPMMQGAMSQGGGVSTTLSRRLPSPEVTPSTSTAAGTGIDPRGTAAFRALRSRVRN